MSFQVRSQVNAAPPEDPTVRAFLDLLAEAIAEAVLAEIAAAREREEAA